MKRKFLSLMLGVLMVFSLFGCQSTPTSNTGGAEETPSQGEESGVIELSVWAEEGNFEMLEGMFETFKQEYAGEAEFNITLIEEGDANVRDDLLSDVHNGPDVFHFPDDQLNSLIAGGVLSAVPNADEVKKANLDEAVTAACLGDTLYAYPMTADNGYFLYYDKDYFTEEDVKTLDGIVAVAEAAGKKFSMEFNSGWYLYSFFGNTGLDFGINEDGVTNHCNWNTTEGEITGIHVAEALVKLVSSSAFIPQLDADFITGVQDGSVIAGISGVWNAVSIKEAWGEDYGAVKLPTYTCNGKQVQMSSFTGYKMIGVNSYSDHVEWAHKLADWITNEENQQVRFEQRNQGPSNKVVAASDQLKNVPAIQAVIEQSQYGVLQRVGNNYWGACTTFADTLVAKKPTGAELQELLDTLVKEITASTAG